MANRQDIDTPEPDSVALIPAADAASDFPSKPDTHGPMPAFGILTMLFEALLNERKQDRRKSMVEKWFHNWRVQVGDDFYPVLRLILPQKDRERSVYHAKEANIAKALIAVLGIEQSPDAIRLLNWKRPLGNQQSAAGDFPGLAYEVVNKRSTVQEGSLRIDKLNDLLDELSRKGSKLEHTRRIFSQFFLQCTAAEIRWIIKIILKDLHVGVKETTVLNVFHPDALPVFNSSSDLKRVAYELWDPNHRSQDDTKTVRMFYSFAPMLSKRPPKNLEEAIRKFQDASKNVTIKVEEKVDGERIQLHKRGTRYFYSSRKSKDYTYLYGERPDRGSLTPYIHEAFNIDATECILDGEMLVWDPCSGRYLPFGTLKSHAGDGAPRRNLSPRPCFKVFDLLFLNGKSLTHMAMSARRKNLERVFTPVPGRFEIMEQRDAHNVNDIHRMLRETVEERGEGLILKHPLSTYVLNGRNDHWIKLKPEYIDGEGETFDLLVVGGNYGSGWRGGNVSTLICAVKDDRPNSAGNGTKWSSFCRIGTGLSYADFVMIRDKPWIEWGSNGPPFLLTAPRSLDDKGDVYLMPESSFVITVKAAEITTSIQYDMGITLRFPRALRIREEFKAEDAATASEIFEHVAAGKKRKQEDATTGPNKKRKTTGRKIAKVAGDFQVQKEADEVPATSSIFAGKAFVIYSAPQASIPYQPNELAKIIRQNGGLIRARRSGKDDEVLIYGGEKEPPEIKAIIRREEENLVYPQWILDSIKKKTKLPLRREYLRFAATAPISGSDTEDDDEMMEQDVQVKQEENQSDAEDVREDTAQMQDNSLRDFEGNPNADWIKVEPDEEIDLGRPSADSVVELSDGENTDHEGPDDDEQAEANEEWTDLFLPIEFDDDAQAMPTSTLEEIRMGETDEAMEYDQNMIFRHLAFYLDLPSCARKHGMKVSATKEKMLEARLLDIGRQIQENGGKLVTELSDPKLTHIVLDQDDLSRRRELISATYRQKLPRLVLSDYIPTCLEEKTLVNEEDFLP